MKRSLFVIMAVLALGVLVLTACGGGAEKAEATDVPVPAPYAGQTNPHSGDAQSAAAGKEVYDTYCTACHGPELKGDGPAGAALNPKPADLTDVAKNDPEDRIHWIISEGGPAAGMSDKMVAFKGTLSDDQIWQLVTYIKSKK
jgi:mono/diheme cytochrome c family protein